MFIRYMEEKTKNHLKKPLKWLIVGIRNNSSLEWETAIVTSLVEEFNSLNHLHI